MLKKSLVETVLARALENGGDFAEIFVEKSHSAGIFMSKRQVHSSQSALNYGAGIRVFNGSFYSYADTSDLSEEGLMRAAAQAAAATGLPKAAAVVKCFPQPVENRHQIAEFPFDGKNAEKIELLRQASELAYACSDKIIRTDAAVFDKVQDVLIANSDGLWAEDRRIRERFVLSPTAESGGETFQNSYLCGGLRGSELLRGLALEEIAGRTAAEAVEMLEAVNCPAGKMQVIMNSMAGGVFFHEAGGHALEATAAAKNASVFCGKKGERIASPLVTMIDDGTIPNAWGSSNIDDEGLPTRKNVLIEKGILKGFLADRFNARIMGVEPTGSSRRESYRYAPTSRMNNTLILNGNDKPEDIVKNTEYGVYAVQVRGGSVNPASGDFNFSVSRAYLVEKGKITKPVKGAKLIGNCVDILKKIDMVGNDMSVSGAGYCGSKSGRVPVCHGTPTLRVSSMTVGGQK